MYGQPQDKATDQYHDRLKEYHQTLLTPHQHDRITLYKKASYTVIKLHVIYSESGSY